MSSEVWPKKLGLISNRQKSLLQSCTILKNNCVWNINDTKFCK